jgi:hypothetical protein
MLRTIQGCVCLVLASVAGADDVRFRAGCLSLGSNLAILEQMRAAGMSAVWVKLDRFAAGSEDASAWRQLGDWAAACERTGIQLWPVAGFADGAQPGAMADFRREVTPKGRVMPRTPCPVDERYWRRVIFPRFLRVAEVATKQPVIAGMFLDLEMRGADHASYGPPCYCDACKAGAGSTNAAAMAAWQGREAERICRELERAVHKINPRLRLGALQLDLPTKWHEGIARGLGTPGLPVTCASAIAAPAGFTDHADKTRARFKRIGAHVSVAGGLRPGQFAAENMAAQLYAAGRRGGGYWMEMADPLELCWDAIKRANAELDKFAVSRGRYESPLGRRPK